MIEYISGELVSLQPAAAVIDCSGVGYLLHISLTTFGVLEKQQLGSKAKLLVQEIIREDAHLLFGFCDNRERELFRLLIGVSGIGANTARMILSAFNPLELEAILASGDDKRLKAVKGIGGKTAQRIIVDLRDKIKPTADALSLQPAVDSAVFDEALTALVTLGFPRPRSQKVLQEIFKADPGASAETAVKRSFSML